jgi:hypothetical protein
MGEVLMKHLTARPEVDEPPEPFPHVIRKSLAKDPKDRYQTVNEMVAEVFRARAGSVGGDFEPGSCRRWRAGRGDAGRRGGGRALWGDRDGVGDG